MPPQVRHFVGRQFELDRFRQVLDDPAGQAILIVGQAGMGKTALAQRMLEVAEDPLGPLQCRTLAYQVTPTDSVDQVMERMLDHAQAAAEERSSFVDTTRQTERWDALLKVLPGGKRLVDLKNALLRGPRSSPREALLGALHLISGLLPDHGRLLFLIDSDKYMAAESDHSWRIVVEQLPERVKFLFAQRPEDALPTSENFHDLPNVVRIPDAFLGQLDTPEVDRLLGLCVGAVPYSLEAMRDAVGSYHGHAYSVAAAVDLLLDGHPLDDLPTDPARVADKQWQHVLRQGTEALRLLSTYAVLDVPVPTEVAADVAQLDAATLATTLAQPYLAGLVPDRDGHRQIYHRLLADHILAHLPEEASLYHQRAVDIYRRRLADPNRPDVLAATRLPEHLLALGNQDGFVNAVAFECARPLQTLGLLSETLALVHRAQELTRAKSSEESALLNHQGLIYRRRGELARAEDMHNQALAFEEELGSKEGMAIQYGNLGLIYRTRGELERAEDMHNQALALEEELGRKEGMASQYGNLGLIHQTRGELARAEDMHKQALALNEELGRKEGMASQYGNLGLIYRTRGELERTRELWTRSRDLFAEVGMPHQVELLERWLAELSPA